LATLGIIPILTGKKHPTGFMLGGNAEHRPADNMHPLDLNFVKPEGRTIFSNMCSNACHGKTESSMQ
jgi:hypothetical protein